jgi:hypothetical protein
MNIPCIIKEGVSISLVVNGEPHIIDRKHPNFTKIRSAIKSGATEDSIEDLINISQSIASSSGGLIEVKDGMVSYKDRPIHNVLSERILSMIDEGFDVKPMLNFLENLQNNPSGRSVERLYTFLEHKNLPITEDGCFLAYKAVDSNFYSKTAGTQIPVQGKVKETEEGSGRYYIYNGVGETVEVARNEVDDDPNAHCSYGLHVGAIEYVRGFGYGDDKYVIVKVNPADSVSVPTDSECQKNRVCKYEVISEMDSKLVVLEKSVYQSDGSEFDSYEDTLTPYEEDSIRSAYEQGENRAERDYNRGMDFDPQHHWSEMYHDGYCNKWDELESNEFDGWDDDDALFTSTEVDTSPPHPLTTAIRDVLGGYDLGSKRADKDFNDGVFYVAPHWSEEYSEGYQDRYVELENNESRSAEDFDEYPQI